MGRGALALTRGRRWAASGVVSCLLVAASLPSGAQEQPSRAQPAQEVPAQQDFKPAPDRPIAKIAVLAIFPSRQVKVYNQNAAGIAFGILPALFYGLDIDKKGAEYVAEMNRRRMTLAPELARLLQRELGRKYQVTWLRQRPRLKEDKSVDYSHIETDADAILSVFYGQVGYLSPHSLTDYYPFLHLGVRMLDARTKSTIYYKQLAVHPLSAKLAGRYDAVQSDDRYRYATFEALMADFERSIQGLLEGQEQLAQRIARDLGVPPPGQPPEAVPAPDAAPAPPQERNGDSLM